MKNVSLLKMNSMILCTGIIISCPFVINFVVYVYVRQEVLYLISQNRYKGSLFSVLVGYI